MWHSCRGSAWEHLYTFKVSSGKVLPARRLRAPSELVERINACTDVRLPDNKHPPAPTDHQVREFFVRTLGLDRETDKKGKNRVPDPNGVLRPLVAEKWMLDEARDRKKVVTAILLSPRATPLVSKSGGYEICSREKMVIPPDGLRGKV